MARRLQLAAGVRALLLIVTLVIAVTAAHADPPRPGLWRSLRTDVVALPDHVPPPLAHLPRASHGVDDDLAAMIDRASRFAGKLCGLHPGVAAFVHVENVTGDHHADAPPRVIVLGLAFGGRK